MTPQISTDLFKYLSESLVIGRDDRAVVVLQVLVDDAAAFPDAETTEAVAGTFGAAAGFDLGNIAAVVFVSRILKETENGL